FHKDEDPKVKAAMRRLYDHRVKTIREDFGADDAEKIVQWIDDYKGENAREWLIKHKADFGTVQPTRMPYYILLVGSPDLISFKFGHWLAGGYAVGRLHFEAVSDYEAYVDSLIRYETEVGKPAPTNKDVVFWGPRQRNDGATKMSSELLVKPLATDDTQIRIFKKLAKAGYKRKLVAPADSKKQALLDLFHRKAGVPAPSMLFTASHGLAWPNGHARQATAQGALLCQDYFGLSAGELKPEHYLSGDDLDKQANVFGMICFHFACYGAGTPAENRFALQGEKPIGVPDKPFFAQLPQALLKHANGGALGVFGHVERAWQTSIATAGAGTQLQPFEEAFWTILSGKPLGHALTGFVTRANELSRQLSGQLEEGKATNKDLADLWLARNDAETFILLGDPAARLRKEDLQ
ncbi:MAG: C25 family cysteine peptidase, partial [Blastocatellia bacterium]